MKIIQVWVVEFEWWRDGESYRRTEVFSTREAAGKATDPNGSIGEVTTALFATQDDDRIGKRTGHLIRTDGVYTLDE